jgi:hypothetical protein
MTLAAPFLALIVAPKCAGQQPTATAVITDLAALPASTAFGVPNQFKLTGTGDVFFTSGGNTGLFRWSQPAGIERLMQTNDPIEKLGIPGLPEGLLDATGALLQANASYAAFIVSAAVMGSEDPGSPVVYDGSSYRRLNVTVSTFSQLLLNASGRVAVLGRTGYWATSSPQRIEVETASSSPRGVLVAETGQPAPGTGGGTFANFPTLIGFNDAGQVAFLAEMNRGNTVRALFLFDGSEVHLVAKSGTAPGDFAFVTATPANYGAGYAFNGAGQVAFLTGTFGGTFGIWIGDASGVTRKLMIAGEATGIEGWGNYNRPSLRGFNDSGEVLYDSTLTDGRHALFLKRLDDSVPKVVFSRGQSGGSAGKFDTTVQASMNNAGKVAFLATLTGGSSPIGWYLGSGATAPAPIVAQADSTPLGGSFGLAGRSTPAAINASNQVLFLADIPDLNAVGLFSWTSGGGVVPVVSSMDSLPDGANTVLRAAAPSSSDTETLVRVLKAGGQAAWYAQQFNPDMPEPRKIVAEFDQVADAGTVVDPDGFSMNSKGEVVFTAALLGSDFYPRGGILASLPASGVKRSVLAGDSVPGGGTITSFGAPQFNNQSQVAFFANTTVGRTAGQGIFIASDAEGIQAVARQGGAWPGGGTFNSFIGSVVLNDSGQVAFRGNGQGSASGLFVGSGGGTPVKVVMTGDPVSTGVTVGGFTNPPPPFQLNAAGQVAYSARLAGGGRYLGVFLGTPGATEYTRQVVALTGDPAPGAGEAAFAGWSEESIDLNSSGQVAFWASWCCSQIGSGWFLGSAEAPLSPRLLPTQPLPGGGSVRDASPGTRFAVLADSGEMAIYVGQVTGGMPQVVIAGADGTLRKFAGNGEKAPDTGSEFGKLYPTLVATPSGRFLFSAMLLNGPAQAGIFVDMP